MVNDKAPFSKVDLSTAIRETWNPENRVISYKINNKSLPPDPSESDDFSNLVTAGYLMNPRFTLVNVDLEVHSTAQAIYHVRKSRDYRFWLHTFHRSTTKTHWISRQRRAKMNCTAYSLLTVLRYFYEHLLLDSSCENGNRSTIWLRKQGFPPENQRSHGMAR